MTPTKIIIEEQGLRDGLQTVSTAVKVEKKLGYINQLVAAGIQRIQVTSFVHPKLVPQMADAEAICSGLPKEPGVIFSALALNTKGVERAIKAGLQHLSISISASNTHSLKNANKTIEEAKTEFKLMVQLAQQAGITVRGGIQCAFGCRFEGAISEELVDGLVQHHIDCGVNEIALADSTGMGNPVQLKKMIRQIQSRCGETPIALHLHNTENKGYANLVAALEVGIKQFDTAFGGLGGCPFIVGATGNIATEDTVQMLHQMGLETGIDIQKVAVVSKDLQDSIGIELPGLMHQLIQRTDIKII